jgi:hypothetical protein
MTVSCAIQVLEDRTGLVQQDVLGWLLGGTDRQERPVSYTPVLAVSRPDFTAAANVA